MTGEEWANCTSRRGRIVRQHTGSIGSDGTYARGRRGSGPGGWEWQARYWCLALLWVHDCICFTELHQWNEAAAWRRLRTSAEYRAAFFVVFISATAEIPDPIDLAWREGGSIPSGAHIQAARTVAKWLMAQFPR